jgi:hypothetical protein
MVGLTPNLLALGLDSLNRAENNNGTIDNAQRTLNLSGEIDMTRCVYQMNRVLAINGGGPRKGSSGRDNRYPALAFLVEIVHHCTTFVDLANAMRGAGMKQKSLGRRRLPSVYMRYHADIADGGQINIP